MNCLLFVDLLGVKARWLRGGREAAEATFSAFREQVLLSLSAIEPSRILSGGVESDSAALVCDKQSTAIGIARELFLNTFRTSGKRRFDRLWLRGVILPFAAQNDLRTESLLPAPFGHVSVFDYSQELLESIAVEKAGFRGMRLLVANSCIDNAVRARFKLPIGTKAFIPFRQLNHSPYPQRLKRDYQDYLWMVSSDSDQWDTAKRMMALRLRQAAGNEQEFLHAAATQLVFHECAAIVGSLRDRTPNDT